MTDNFSLCYIVRYQVMRDCWQSEPGLRPSFTELSAKIFDVLTEGSKDQYLQLDELTKDDPVPPDVIPQSFKTLPRNFRLRSNDSDEEMPPKQKMSPLKLSTRLQHKLVRQMTVPNPGYSSSLLGRQPSLRK